MTTSVITHVTTCAVTRAPSVHRIQDITCARSVISSPLSTSSPLGRPDPREAWLDLWTIATARYQSAHETPTSRPLRATVGAAATDSWRPLNQIEGPSSAG